MAPPVSDRAGRLWPKPTVGRNRPTVGATTLYAIDAKTGKPRESFGDKGQMSVVNRALDFAYPGKFAKDVDPVSLGYFSLTTPRTYYNGTLYVGLSHGDSHIIGGLLVALDGTTGAVKWTFNPVPQHNEDSGWEIAKDTWKGGRTRRPTSTARRGSA